MPKREIHFWIVTIKAYFKLCYKLGGVYVSTAVIVHEVKNKDFNKPALIYF